MEPLIKATFVIPAEAWMQQNQYLVGSFLCENNLVQSFLKALVGIVRVKRKIILGIDKNASRNRYCGMNFADIIMSRLIIYAVVMVAARLVRQMTEYNQRAGTEKN